MNQHETEPYGLGRTLEPLLTVTETAGMLGIGNPTLYRLIRLGELRPTRVGQRLRFEPQVIRAYLDRNREAVASP